MTTMREGINMMKHAGWMKSLALVASVCASGFAAGCASDLSSGETQQSLFEGMWIAPTNNGVTKGFEGGLGPLPVCRSPFDGGQQPGKVWQGQCNFGWGGQEHRSFGYQVLLDGGYNWVGAGLSLPGNAIIGGDAGNAANHVTLGVCLAFRSADSTWHPGKFYAGNCNIAWGGSELAVSPDLSGHVRILVLQ